jgi:hypothetical protein
MHCSSQAFLYLCIVHYIGSLALPSSAAADDVVPSKRILEARLTSNRLLDGSTVYLSILRDEDRRAGEDTQNNQQLQPSSYP